MPTVYEKLCTRRLLVTEWIDGVKLTSATPGISALYMCVSCINVYVLVIFDNYNVSYRISYTSICMLISVVIAS